MRTNVVAFSQRKPQTFTAPEALIDQVAEFIITDGRTYKQFAAECSLSTNTIQRLASRQTRWPRATTLFPILAKLNVAISLTKL